MCDRKSFPHWPRSFRQGTVLFLTLQAQSLGLFSASFSQPTSTGRLSSGSNNIPQGNKSLLMCHKETIRFLEPSLWCLKTHVYLPLCRTEELHWEQKIMRTKNRKSEFTPKVMLILFILTLIFEVDLK